MFDQPLDSFYNIVLIGFRAAGKTTVGRRLAELLNRPFYDLDQVLEQEAGKTIARLVAQEGWPAFRRREKALVERFASQKGLVLATGGGVILDPENTTRLKASGRLVWLKTAPETIRARLRRSQPEHAARPGLTDKGTLNEIDEVLVNRTPLYQAAAEAIIETDALTADEITQRLLILIKSWEQSKP
ncbi:shikimate kinase [Desulfobacca acetoxidans]